MAFAIAAGSASAATVSVSGGTMQFQAASGEANRVDVISDTTAGGGTVQFSDDGAAVTPGAGCSGGGAPGNVVTCTGVGFSTFDSGNLNDVLDVTAQNNFGTSLHGASGNDALDGSALNDVLIGGSGDDELNGGGGTDIAAYNLSTAAVTVNLGLGFAFGDGTDSLTGIENVVGSNHADVLGGSNAANSISGGGGNDTLNGFGGADTLHGSGDHDELLGGDGNDVLNGNDGADELRGGANNDTIDGGTGFDTADLSSSPAAVTASLFAGTATGEGSDSLAAIEALRGSDRNDTLIGDNGPNILEGGAGNDEMNGAGGGDGVFGGGGDDTIRGGLGADFVSGDVGVDALYGDNNDEFTGPDDHDTIQGGADSDTLVGERGNDTLDGGAGNDTLRGGGENDTLDGSTGDDSVSFTASPGGVTANLETGVATGEGTDSLDDFEIVLGSNHNDVLTLADGIDGFLVGLDGNDALSGRDGDDNLLGGNGDDSMQGRGGDDQYFGDPGGDIARFSASSAPVSVNLGTGIATGEGTDTLIGVEEVLGSMHGDTVVGDAGANTLFGNLGDDTLDGAGGNDELAGQVGNDTARFTSSVASVSANLVDNQATGHGTDRLFSIENLTGSSGNDLLFGNGDANTLSGGSGNDHLAGRGGDDALDGGGGTDAADYSESPGPVAANLATGAATGDGSDTLASIEGLFGSEFADTLTGNGAANRILALDGGDTIDGAGGEDELLAGFGDDSLLIRDDGPDSADCGAGTDSVTADQDGVDTIDADCENVEFPAQPDPDPEPDPGPIPQPTSPPGGNQAPGQQPEGDTTAPLVSGTSASRRRVRRGRALSFGYSLSEPASVELFIQRRRKGVRLEGSDGDTRCVASNVRNRRTLRRQIRSELGARARGRGGKRRVRRSVRRARCALYRQRTMLRQEGEVGSNSRGFTGRVRGKALRVGRYRVELIATDEAGNESTPARAGFRVVRARRR